MTLGRRNGVKEERNIFLSYVELKSCSKPERFIMFRDVHVVPQSRNQILKG